MAVYKAKAKFVHKLPRFKIFYCNGSTYTDRTGPLEKAPKEGVVVIIAEDKVSGRRYEQGTEFYCFTSDGWEGTSHFSLYKYLAEPGYKLVLFGSESQDSRKQYILEIAKKDDYIKK